MIHCMVQQTGIKQQLSSAEIPKSTAKTQQPISETQQPIFESET